MKIKPKTSSFAKEVASGELEKRRFPVRYGRGGSLLVNQKRINVRGCNYDNDWARRINALGGWDKINPEGFDYLICVSFDGKHEDVRFFVFTKEEVLKFSTTPLAGRESGLKNLELFRNNEKSDRIVKSSENKWDKL